MSGIGLTIPARSLDDHFVVALVRALADPLIENGMSLVTKVVPDDASEEDVYRHWARVGGISGVALLGVDRVEDGRADPRVELLGSLGFPLAAVVDSSQQADFPAVVVDSDASVAVLRSFLETRAPRRVVYITGPEERRAASARIPAVEAAELDGLFEVVRTDHSVDAAVAAGNAAIGASPVTLVFDSDVHAAAALASVRARALRVPEEVAIISWTNSALCQSTSRSITAIDRRGGEIGALLGARVIGAIAGDRATRDRAPDPYVVVGETA